MRRAIDIMVTVRPATEHDLPAILDIFNEAILNTTAAYDYQPHTLNMRTAWFQAKEDGGFPVFVAQEEEAVVGFSTIGPFRTRTGYRYTAENTVYVAAHRRGQGIGKLLLAPLIEAAERLEMHAIIAVVDASNEASHRLHRSFGFVEVAHMKEVGYKFGRWLDLKFFQLLLDTPSRTRENEPETL